MRATEVTFDMLNLMHYFDKNQGTSYFVSNQNDHPDQLRRSGRSVRQGDLS